MKIIFIFLMIMSTVFAQEERVIKVLSQNNGNHSFRVEQDSYERNIMGYGCAWPGLRYPFIFSYFAKLKHGTGLANDVIPLREADLQMQFCDSPTAQELFGPKFVVGNVIPLYVSIELLQVRKDGRKFIKEIIKSELNGHKLESIAYLALDGAD